MPTLEQLFWARVRKNSPRPKHCPELGPCWVWMLAPTARGYGNFKYASKQYATHRLAWELQVGPVPAGLSVLHRCDNRLCTRGSHLFLGTQRDNREDMDQKKRRVNPTGERHGQSKFTDDQIRGMSQKDVSARTGISQSHLSKILSGNDRRVQ